VDFVSNHDSFFASDDDDEESAMRESIASSYVSDNRVTMNFGQAAGEGVRGTVTETADQLYGLMEQIESTVWDNIKLTHINAKLLEYARRQAMEAEAANPPLEERRSIEEMKSELSGLQKKNGELVEQVKHERSMLLLQVRNKEFTLQG